MLQEKALPNQLELVEDSYSQPRALEISTMNIGHDNKQRTSKGWTARGNNGVVYFQSLEETQVRQWLISNGYVDAGDGIHYR
jgi:hypothetical protein